MPRVGVDYPGTWQAFESWFPDDDACREFLADVRWPDGFRCPACDGGEAWTTARGLWVCRGCGRQTSVTAGTIFHRSALPAAGCGSRRCGSCAPRRTVSPRSACGGYSGSGSYGDGVGVAAQVAPGDGPSRPRTCSAGDGVSVEMDQTFIGGRTQGKRAPRYANKSRVAIAVERRHPKGLGRVRLRHIDMSHRPRRAVLVHPRHHRSPSRPCATAREHLHLGNLSPPAPSRQHPGVLTRARPTSRCPQSTRSPRSSSAGSPAHSTTATPTPTSPTTSDEFTFRFNRRTSRSRGLLWYRLVQQAVNTDPHPYDILTHKM